jgi:hypothetical protein
MSDKLSVRIFHQWIFGFSIGIFNWGCGGSGPGNRTAMREEMRSREVVHLTPAQISDRAFELGDTLSTKTIGLWMQKISSGDNSCTPGWTAVQTEIKKDHDATAQRLSFEETRSWSMLKGKEKEVADAYAYQKQNRQPILPNIQKDGDKDYLYSRALTISDSKCLACHSTLKSQGSELALGDTIGILLLRYPKKLVVMSFVE